MNKLLQLVTDKGFTAATDGEPRESNPYLPGSRLHTWWDKGWLEHVPHEDDVCKCGKPKKEWRSHCDDCNALGDLAALANGYP